MPRGSGLLWYTFMAIVVYLLVVHWKGANALLGTGFRGYASAVTVLQGRNPGRVIRP